MDVNEPQIDLRRSPNNGDGMLRNKRGSDLIYDLRQQRTVTCALSDTQRACARRLDHKHQSHNLRLANISGDTAALNSWAPSWSSASQLFHC